MSLSWLNKHLRLPFLGCRDLCKHHRICHFMMWSEAIFLSLCHKKEVGLTACVFNPQNFREIGPVVFFFFFLSAWVINFFSSCCSYLVTFWLQCSPTLIRAWYFRTHFSTSLLLEADLNFLGQFSGRVIKKLVYFEERIHFLLNHNWKLNEYSITVSYPDLLQAGGSSAKFPLVFPPFPSCPKAKGKKKKKWKKPFKLLFHLTPSWSGW